MNALSIEHRPCDKQVQLPQWYTSGRTCVVGFVQGSCSPEASRRGSDVNKQMDLVFYLFLTGVREVAEPSDTSTTSELQ